VYVPLALYVADGLRWSVEDAAGWVYLLGSALAAVYAGWRTGRGDRPAWMIAVVSSTLVILDFSFRLAVLLPAGIGGSPAVVLAILMVGIMLATQLVVATACWRTRGHWLRPRRGGAPGAFAG
jgi:hypothetical protein